MAFELSDAILREEGVPCEYADGFIIYIAPLNSKRFQDTYKEVEREYRRTHKRGRRALGSDVQKEIFRLAISDGCVTGWEGLFDKGKPVPYSPEAARSLLDKSQAIYNFVTEMANEDDAYRSEAKEEGKGKPSAG